MDFGLVGLFGGLLNMSITASIVIAVVLLVRLPLRKAPGWISYALWFVVLFRLLSPFSFKSRLSLFNLFEKGGTAMNYIPSDIGMMAQPRVNAVIPAVTEAVNASLPAATPVASVNPMQAVMLLLSVVWVTGVAALLIYSTVSYLLLRKRISTAVLFKDNIYQSDRIASPFVCGFFKPKIYLPVSLRGSELEYIIQHEETHIRRLDHLVKPTWFIALCLHWFNPFVWLSFHLMSRDMEMSCDELVIQKLGEYIRKEYSSSLLDLSSPSRLFAGSPLAFGETGTMARIKNISIISDPPSGSLWLRLLPLL